ncbi:MAG: dicarboxylate/amino acid:cation symporter [Alphaproteobacteria bacterium]
MKRYFPALIAAAMILGVLTGFLINSGLAPDQAKSAAAGLTIITDVFLRLIKMIIAPLVFSTLVAGIAHMEDSAAIGRVGVKTLSWFLFASLISLTLGLVMVELLQPGAGLSLALPPTSAESGVATASFSLKDFITHLVPASIIDAMAKNEILQIVVFSVFVGSAVAALDGKAPLVLAACEQLAAVMLKITSYVMVLAPLVVFAALASTVATSGLGIVVVYAKFVGGFYLSLAILCAILLAFTFLAVGRRTGELVRGIREPWLLAFSTATSEAAYPGLLAGLPRFGVPRRIVSFVLPLGYSFNLDGSMIYCTFASLFIAQAYGIHLSLAQMITMLALLMITSKGIAGVPRASLVVIAATLPVFHLPEAGLLLILGVDHLLDMGRSATNVVGNSVAAVIVSKWEKQLRTAEEAAAAVARV